MIQKLIIDMKKVNEDIVFNVDDVSKFQMRINDEIVFHGLDNQDTVNDLGIKLYEIYDEILYQKHHQ